MKYHSLSGKATREVTNLLLATLKHRFQDLGTVAEKVGWSRDELGAWFQSPDSATLQESATLTLHCYGMPDEEDRGRSLASFDDAQPRRDYGDAVSERPSPPWDSDASTPSRDPGASEETPEEATGRAALRLMRWYERLMIEMGIVGWEEVLASHQEMEELYRLRGPSSA